jgi:hypothetical protein
MRISVEPLILRYLGEACRWTARRAAFDPAIERGRQHNLVVRRGPIQRHAVRARLNGKLKQVKATLRRMMHLTIPEQGRYLRLVLSASTTGTPFRPTPLPSTPSITALAGCAASGDEASGIA